MYTHAAKSQVVQTAWVVITLLHAKYPHKERIKKAVKVIMDRQLPDGSWAQEQIEGIFNRYVEPCSCRYARLYVFVQTDSVLLCSRSWMDRTSWWVTGTVSIPIDLDSMTNGRQRLR